MRKLLSIGVVVAAVLAVVTPVLTNVGAQAAPVTTVVLNFEEGWANQSVVPAMLDAHGMKGTFYVNSGTIDQPGWFTWQDLLNIQADGHEIGGASIDQQDLSALETATPGAAQTQICQDRARLTNHGLTAVKNFAYPFGVGYDDATVKAAVQACGYNSGLRQWGIVEDGLTAASLADPYAIETAPQPESTTTAATLEASVTNAASHGGGVVPFVFHQICSACDQYSTSTATLNAFLSWLQTKAPAGVTVKTMDQVIGGSYGTVPALDDTTAPTSTIACDSVTCQGSYAEGNSISISLDGADEVNGSGLDGVRYTTDGSTPTIASPRYTAPFPITWTTTIKYAAWDNAGNVESLNTTTITIPDTIDPTSTIACGGTSCDGRYFNPQSAITLAGVDNGSGIKTIRFTTDGTTPTASIGTIYTGPFTVPASATIKFVSVDNANNVEAFVNTQSVMIDTAAPVASATCNAKACAAGWYQHAVKVAMAGTDTGASGLGGIHYTLDNSTPTAASRLYTGPITLTASKWVKYVAVDNAGNVSAVKAKLVQIDTSKPTVVIKPGDGKKVTGVVKIAITSHDTKSGVARLKFSIDGHKVKVVSGAKLSINWNTAKVVKTKHTLTATATDKAGNATTKTVHLIVK